MWIERPPIQTTANLDGLRSAAPSRNWREVRGSGLGFGGEVSTGAHGFLRGAIWGGLLLVRDLRAWLWGIAGLQA